MLIIDNKDISMLSEEKWNNVKHLYINGKKFNFRKRLINLLEVKRIFNSMNIVFFLAHGVLLGAYREKDFIKWDDDIELDTLDKDFKPKWKEMYNSFIKEGFVVRSYNRPKGFKMNLYRYKEKISIRGLYFDSEYSDKFILTKSFCYPSEFYKKPEKIKFKGFYFDAPRPIENYLLYVYGRAWEKPMNCKNKNKLNKDWSKRGVKRKFKVS